MIYKDSIRIEYIYDVYYKVIVEYLNCLLGHLETDGEV